MNSPNSDIRNAFTVDVEDYFHVQSFADRIDPRTWDQYESRVARNTQRILRILDQHRVRGTFFVLGWVADRFPELVNEIHQAGHEIGCHSFSHRLIYNMTPDEFREDLLMGCKVIEEITGERVVSFRAPSFSITEKSLWALDILIEEGFQFDSSIFPVYHDTYGIPNAERFPHRVRGSESVVSCQLSVVRGRRDQEAGGRSQQSEVRSQESGVSGEEDVRCQVSGVRGGRDQEAADESSQLTTNNCQLATSSLWEFPPTVYRMGKLNVPVAGGGYFRLYPVRLSIHWLRRINRRHRQPFVFYIHPWELDTDQPRLPAGLKSRFRHYQNLGTTKRKLTRLLESFHFGPVSEVLQQRSEDAVITGEPALEEPFPKPSTVSR